jgi:arginine utilization regulatory protein
MLRRYVEQILQLYNYIDGLVVTDNKGIIEYFTTFRPNINNLKEEEVLHHHVLDVYPNLTEESSSIMRVLKTGIPIYNKKQHLKTNKNSDIYALNTTLPIMHKNKVIGAVDVSRYIEPKIKYHNINLNINDKTIKPHDSKLYTIDDIITNSSSMIKIKDKILKIAKTDSSVLIQGETGTGKELVAQAIHSHSNRYLKPFVSQNCAAIPSTLLESILFGTVKGSYTGAENKKGLFEVAQGGTLFLDEINAMEINIQPKLLKAIENKVIRRLGDTKQINIDVRIVTAVNENPQKSIDDGRLREDLFYRLAVVQINLPPLRNRKNDIKFLTNFFINKFNKAMNRNIMGLETDVEDLFNKYQWPGNVRELKNLIEGVFNFTDSNFIQRRNLPDYILENIKQKENLFMEQEVEDMSLKTLVENYEKNLIFQALKKSTSKVEAAKLLKISKQSLDYKVSKYNLDNFRDYK